MMGLQWNQQMEKSPCMTQLSSRQGFFGISHRRRCLLKFNFCSKQENGESSDHISSFVLITTMLSALVSCLYDLNWWTTVTILSLTCWIIKWIWFGTSDVPPGPRGLPVVGYLPFLSENIHEDFVKLSKKYGRIFSLKMGSLPVVVLNDFSSIKEAWNGEILEKHPELFKCSEECPSLAHQEDWKDWRKFSLTALRSLGMGKSKLKELTEDVTAVALENLGKKSNEDVNLTEELAPAINTLIISLICGKKLQHDLSVSKMVDNFNHNFLAYVKITNLLMCLPFLKPFVRLFSKKVGKCKLIFSDMENFLWEKIKFIEKEPNVAEPETFIDFYYKELHTRNGHSNLNKGALNGNSQLLLLGGSETTLVTIEWLLLTLAQNPKIQERAFQEIIEVFGKEFPPQYQEKHRLPFLNAVLAESSRFNTVLPAGVAHWTKQAVTVGGLNIPKHTLVFTNLYAVHNDPNLWQRPEVFNPERFLSPDGKNFKEPEYLIPFSIGKRMCIGEKLAREQLFTLVSAIIQRFKILPPSGGINMEAILQTTLGPKYPIVRIEPRN